MFDCTVRDFYLNGLEDQKNTFSPQGFIFYTAICCCQPHMKNAAIQRLGITRNNIRYRKKRKISFFPNISKTIANRYVENTTDEH